MQFSFKKKKEAVGEYVAVVWVTRHFLEYLFGTPFYVDYGSRTIAMVDANKYDKGKLAIWSLLLQEYDMKVVHKRGVLDTNADCFCRYFRENKSIEEEIVLPDWSKGDYHTFQGICDISTAQLDSNRLFQSEI